MSTCTVATNNLFYKSYQLFKHCTIHDHFRALWHRQDCLEFVKTELRIQIAYIMLTQERGNKRSETLMLNSVSAKHFTFCLITLILSQTLSPYACSIMVRSGSGYPVEKELD